MHARALCTCFLMTLTLSACAQDRLSTADAQTTTTPAVRRATDTDDHRPHAGMLRYPDVSATHIAFVYANDIWMVPREGEMALARDEQVLLGY